MRQWHCETLAFRDTRTSRRLHSKTLASEALAFRDTGTARHPHHETIALRDTCTPRHLHSKGLALQDTRIPRHSVVIILSFIIAYSIEHSFLYSVPTTYLSRSTQTLRALAATFYEGGSKLWIFPDHLPITHPSADSPLLVHHLSLSPPTQPLASFHKWPWLYPPSTPHLTRAAHLPHPSPKRARLWGVHWHRTD